MGLIGFVLACIGLMCCWLPLLGQIAAIAGGLAGLIALGRAARIRAHGGYADHGLALAAVVIAVLALVPATLVLGLAWLMSGGATMPPDITYF
jgi:hypothetical protein